ncbi:hypothetical protein AVEN_68522-1 [Araneus ventricosus]|uniref:Uncharacterized protein n=1 Tax=Araneus ventricosus TaxID=182803 RepID=A0A4Y2HCQ9_ARAVE|nr:hypothetical protein AVEN_68522-1 [Araneus ventricosus]
MCLLLKRYKLTAEKFHCKPQDFAYEVINYFHRYISGLDISPLHKRKELIIVDKIKRRFPPEVREHFIVGWSQHNNVEKLASNLDDYDAVPTKSHFHTSNPEEELNTERTLRLTRRALLDIVDIYIVDIYGRVCADTCATRFIAGELMFNLLRERGVDFQKMEVTITLADGSRTTMEVNTAPVSIDIEGRAVSIDMLALPKAKDKRKLLGTDFSEKSGIVLDLKNKRLHFNDKPCHKICF